MRGTEKVSARFDGERKRAREMVGEKEKPGDRESERDRERRR